MSEPDNYMELVKGFPLKTIKGEAEHDRAMEMVSELTGRAVDAGPGIIWMRCWCW